MKKFIAIIFVLLLVFSLVACASAPPEIEPEPIPEVVEEPVAAEPVIEEPEPEPEPEEDPVMTFVSEGSGLTIDYPYNWTESSENLNAILELNDSKGYFEVYVYEEAKADLSSRFTFDDYVSIVAESTKAVFDLGIYDESEVKDIFIGEGSIPAKFIEIKGGVDRVFIAFINTCFETDDYFFHISSIARFERLDQMIQGHKALLETIRFE